MSKSTTYYPNLKQSVYLVLLLLAFEVVYGLLGRILKSYFPNRDFKHFIDMAVYCITILNVIIIAADRSKLKNGAAPLLKIKSAIPGFIFIGIILTSLLVANSIALLLDPVVAAIPLPRTLETFFQQMTDPNIFVIASVIIAAPILEEVLFRGIILDSLLKQYKPTTAIIYSALFFSLAHFNPWQAIPAFFVGCLMGWLYIHTRSLLPCILIHFVNNAGGYFYDLTTLYRKVSPGILITVLCVIIYVGCWALDKMMKQANNPVITIDPFQNDPV